eukprot:gene4049-14132_t
MRFTSSSSVAAISGSRSDRDRDTTRTKARSKVPVSLTASATFAAIGGIGAVWKHLSGRHSAALRRSTLQLVSLRSSTQADALGTDLAASSSGDTWEICIVTVHSPTGDLLVTEQSSDGKTQRLDFKKSSNCSSVDLEEGFNQSLPRLLPSSQFALRPHDSGHGAFKLISLGQPDQALAARNDAAQPLEVQSMSVHSSKASAQLWESYNGQLQSIQFPGMALKQALMDLNFVEDAYMQANEKSEDYAERVHEKEEEIAFLEGKVIKLEAALKAITARVNVIMEERDIEPSVKASLKLVDIQTLRERLSRMGHDYSPCNFTEPELAGSPILEAGTEPELTPPLSVQGLIARLSVGIPGTGCKDAVVDVTDLPAPPLSVAGLMAQVLRGSSSQGPPSDSMLQQHGSSSQGPPSDSMLQQHGRSSQGLSATSMLEQHDSSSQGLYSTSMLEQHGSSSQGLSSTSMLEQHDSSSQGPPSDSMIEQQEAEEGLVPTRHASQGEGGQVESEIGEVKGEVGEVKGAIGQVKDDIGVVKGGVGEVEGEVGEVDSGSESFPLGPGPGEDYPTPRDDEISNTNSGVGESVMDPSGANLDGAEPGTLGLNHADARDGLRVSGVRLSPQAATLGGQETHAAAAPLDSSPLPGVRVPKVRLSPQTATVGGQEKHAAASPHDSPLPALGGGYTPGRGARYAVPFHAHAAGVFQHEEGAEAGCTFRQEERAEAATAFRHVECAEAATAFRQEEGAEAGSAFRQEEVAEACSAFRQENVVHHRRGMSNMTDEMDTGHLYEMDEAVSPGALYPTSMLLTNMDQIMMFSSTKRRSQVQQVDSSDEDDEWDGRTARDQTQGVSKDTVGTKDMSVAIDLSKDTDYQREQSVNGSGADDDQLSYAYEEEEVGHLDDGDLVESEGEARCDNAMALKQALMDLNFVEDAYMQANEKSEDYAERVHEKEEEIALRRLHCISTEVPK